MRNYFTLNKTFDRVPKALRAPRNSTHVPSSLLPLAVCAKPGVRHAASWRLDERTPVQELSGCWGPTPGEHHFLPESDVQNEPTSRATGHGAFIHWPKLPFNAQCRELLGQMDRQT